MPVKIQLAIIAPGVDHECLRVLTPGGSDKRLPHVFAELSDDIVAGAIADIWDNFYEIPIPKSPPRLVHTFFEESDAGGVVESNSVFYILIPYLLSTMGRDCQWRPLKEMPSHPINDTIRERVFSDFLSRPIVYELLPEVFSLTELQEMYSIAATKELDKRNFRRKALHFGLLTSTGTFQENVSHRAAELYSFDRDAYNGEEYRLI